MSKKNLSRDQKRKAKLAERAKKAPKVFDLAYGGAKYKTDELTPVFHQIETAINEAYVITDFQLTDRHVANALTKMVVQMRDGSLPPLTETDTINYVVGQEDDLVVECIRRAWKAVPSFASRTSKSDLIGVLRTLLNSIRVWGSPSQNSRGYLQFVQGFLKKTGVQTRRIAPAIEIPTSRPDPELLTLGRAWCLEDDSKAKEGFHQLARSLIAGGKADQVVNACHELMGEVGLGPYLRPLGDVSLEAQEALDRRKELPPPE